MSIQQHQCVGAFALRERVVKAFEVVEWFIYRRTSEVVINSDAFSVHIFDLERRVLHQVLHGQYTSMPITDVREDEGIEATVATVQLRQSDDLVRSLATSQTELTTEVKVRLIEITACHQDTQQRVLALHTCD